MKLVGIIAIIYALVGISGGPWGRCLSNNEITFIVLLIAIDLILLTDTSEKG